MPISDEVKAEYVSAQGGFCPRCRNSAVDVMRSDGFTAHEDGEVTHGWECLSCGRRWQDTYLLVGVEELPRKAR